MGKVSAEGRPKRSPWLRRLVLVTVLGALAALVVLWLRGPSIPATSVLTLDLRAPVPERGQEGLAGFLGGSRLDLLGLRRALLSAERDPAGHVSP